MVICHVYNGHRTIPPPPNSLNNSIESSYNLQFRLPPKSLNNSMESSYNENMSKNINSGTKRWVVVFRTLANVNRIKIIKMLSGGGRMNVTEISTELSISFKATSNHLAMLRNLNVIEATGASGHIFYFINQNMPKDFREAIKLLG